jgi:hypothetical protein
MPPFIVRSKKKSEDPNDYSECNSTPWHPELTVLNLVVNPLKTKMISIKGHEYHSAQSSYQSHDLTYQIFCKIHVSHGNNALSSIAETTSRGLDAFSRHGNRWKTNPCTKDMCASIIGQEHAIALITAYFLLRRSDSGNKRTEHDVGVGVRIQVNRTSQLDFLFFLKLLLAKIWTN